MKIHIQITGKRGHTINIKGKLKSDMPPTDIVRMLFFLEKDFNMLHADQRMHIDLEESYIEPSPAA